jgi:hypothetical protein
MRRKIKAGLTSLSLPVIVYDTASTTGGGLSGLTHTTSGLILEYRRQGQSSWTQLGVGTGLVSKTLGNYVSGGIVDNGSRAGRYEIDIPDAAIAAGARMVEICLRGAANMHPVDIEIELDAVDYQTDAFGALKPTTAGRTLDVSAGGEAGIDLANVGSPTTTLNLSGTTIKTATDIETDTQDIQSRIPAALNGGRMASNAEVVSDSTIAKEATLTNRPTLVQIEASSVLAKEATVNSVLTAIQNLNNLSAKMNVYGTPLMEIPDSGTTTYAFTVVVRDDEDKLVALDASPTIAAANAAGTSRSANLSVVSNPSTGRYTFTYSVASTHPAENLRITISGTVSGEARYVEWIGSVVDYETITTLLAIKAKTDNLPANPAAVSDIPTANQNRDAVWNASTTVTYVDGSMGDRILISNNNTREISVTGSGHVASVLHDAEPNSIPEDAFVTGALSARVLADGAIDAGSIAAGALNGKGDWLTTLGATAPAGWINDPAIASDAVTKITVNLFKYGDVQRWTSPANQLNVTITKVS